MSNELKRRVVLPITVALLLPAAYVASAVSAAFLYAAGWLPQSAVAIAQPVYAPLNWYVRAEYPGSDALVAMAEAAAKAGHQIAH